MGTPQLRKDKSSWLITFTHNGQQVRHYSGHPSEEKNKLILTSIAADIENGTYDTSRNRYRKPRASKAKAMRQITPTEALNRYLLEGNLKPSTAHTYSVAVGCLKGLRGNSSEDVLGHLQKKNLKCSTIKRIFTCISAAYTHVGIKWDKPSVPKGESTSNANSEPHWFSGDEVREILGWAEKNFSYLLFIKLALETGARPGELIALTPQDYNPERGVLTISKNVTEVSGRQVFNATTKTNNKRIIPVNHRLRELLANKKGHLVIPPFNDKDYFDYRLFKRDFSKNFPSRTPYNFRDTFIFEQLFIHNIPIDVVSAWVGNSPEMIRASYLSRNQVAMRHIPL